MEISPFFPDQGRFGANKGYFLNKGKTEELRENVRKFILTPASDAVISEVAGVLDVFRVGKSVSVIVENCDDAKRGQLKEISANGLTETALNLDEIFEAYVIGNRGEAISV